MDASNLFRYCKKGDFENLKLLLDHSDVDVNIRDKWDSTPLYYACLCGHEHLVKYLIEAGARCEANTFDGERCLYGALTDSIRRLLLQHNWVTSHTIRRDAFGEFLRKIFETGEESDILFIIGDKKFYLHRCILAARSYYFCYMLSSKWRLRQQVVLNGHKVNPTAFEAVMKYIYTGRFECPIDFVEECIKIGINCRLPAFKSLVEEAKRKALLLQIGKHGLINVTTVVIEPETLTGVFRDVGVENDLRELAQAALPEELRVWPTEMPFCHTDLPSLHDVCFIVEAKRFICHKVFFTPRSEYFRALIEDHFHEADWNCELNVPVIHLNEISSVVFAVFIHYLYCNQMLVTIENAAEVLAAADMYLISGLKRLCGIFLGQNLNTDNVLKAHELSRVYYLSRLEDRCVAFMAKHLDQIVRKEQFFEIVISDAEDVKARQETDSVTIIDELRYHISSDVQSISEIQEAKSKLLILEELLEELSLEA